MEGLMEGNRHLQSPLEVCPIQAILDVTAISVGLRTRARAEQAYSKCWSEKLILTK